jgi:phage terminase large subunit GpA-like protein
MQVFYNTRLARTWNQTREMTRPAELHARAEPYPLRTVPEGIVILTASVDVQDDRLEFLIKGWGEGLERWTLDYQAIHGDPALPDVWKQLDELIKTPLRNVFGVNMKIRATAIDSGGHYTQEVYEFARERKAHGVFAVKGASRPGRPVIAQLPSRVDVNIRGKTERNGASLWIVGTDTAKDWLYSRLRIPSGHGGCHFSQELPLDYYDQLCSERRLIKYIKGHKRAEWVKARADRNEALDLDVYALAAAHRIGLHKWRENDWERERKKLVAKRPTPASVVQEDVAVIKPGESGAPRRLTITSTLA